MVVIVVGVGVVVGIIGGTAGGGAAAAVVVVVAASAGDVAAVELWRCYNLLRTVMMAVAAFITVVTYCCRCC